MPALAVKGYVLTFEEQVGLLCDLFPYLGAYPLLLQSGIYDSSAGFQFFLDASFPLSMTCKPVSLCREVLICFCVLIKDNNVLNAQLSY